jgi:hypothetical chaperone protein
MMLRPITGGPNPMASRARLELALAPPLERIRARIGEVLSQAGVSTGQIGTVFMTGGSSGLPRLRHEVQSLLPDTRIATGDMLGSVGTGLALEARRRFG